MFMQLQIVKKGMSQGVTSSLNIICLLIASLMIVSNITSTSLLPYNENLRPPSNFSPASCLPKAIFPNLRPPLNVTPLSVKLRNEYKKLNTNSPGISEALT